METNVRQLINVRKQAAVFVREIFQEVSSSLFEDELIVDSELEHQLTVMLRKTGTANAAEKTKQFFDQLRNIREDLNRDAAFIFEGDPAGHAIEEVVSSYPGFFSIAVFRMANFLHKLDVPFLPRIFSSCAHSITGIDIHPGAVIGVPFSIDHGTGVVIGETARIGHNVKLFQGVTLGALTVEKALEHKKRHPTVENHVIIYANSTILGGDTIVGAHTVIGGNVFLTRSVAPYSLVYHQAEISIRPKNRPENEPINFVI